MVPVPPEGAVAGLVAPHKPQQEHARLVWFDETCVLRVGVPVELVSRSGGDAGTARRGPQRLAKAAEAAPTARLHVVLAQDVHDDLLDAVEAVRDRGGGGDGVTFNTDS
jgi:hypothetical protein